MWWTLVFSLVATARAYDIVDRVRPPGEPAAIGACGAPLPREISRRARAHRLVCGGAVVQLPVRTAIKSPQYESWSRLERSDAAGTMDTRRQMQAIRLREDPVHFAGETKIKTYETWVTSVRMRGPNPNRCRVWQRPYTHRYTVQEPIVERRCHDLPPPSSPGSGRSRGGGGSWGGGGGGKSSGGGSSRPRGPDLGRRMDPSRLPKWNSKPSTGGRGGSRGGGSRPSGRRDNRRAALEWLADLIFPRAHAFQGVCEDVVVGHRPRVVEEIRYETMVDTCEWEEDRVETRACSEEPVTFAIDFAKPDAYDPEWVPGRAKYHDLLPNKYDLMPGEWELYTLLINSGTKDKTLGVGRAEGITAAIDVANAWNEYDYARPRLTCAKNTPVHLNLKVTTKHRIVRKAPNALDEVVDRLGKGRGVQAEETYRDGDGTPVRGRPYRLQLTDHSNQAMLTAARQSRKFADLDPEARVTTLAGAPNPAGARELGFTKNTLLKIKIIEKGGCFGEGEKVFADVLDTTADLTKAEGDTLLVPLDGSQAGVPTFYRPFGFIGRLLGTFGPLDLHLNPGLAYEFRVSMLQQGLPFYENGCRHGRANCEPADANPRMFSEELKIKFVADPRRDDRSWWQRYEYWYGKKWWNKFRRCGEAS